MPLKLFIVPVKNLAVPEGEMDAFLRSPRVLAEEVRWRSSPQDN